MKNNRKDIDKFLIILDNFIELHKDILSEEDIFTLLYPLKMGKASTFGPKDSIPLSTIVPLINKPQQNKYRKGARVRRSDNYIRRVAYKLEYTSVKGASYFEIFSKLLSNRINKEITFGGLKLKNFYKEHPGEEFIIPKEYGQIDLDLYYTGEYEIIK